MGKSIRRMCSRPLWRYSEMGPDENKKPGSPRRWPKPRKFPSLPEKPMGGGVKGWPEYPCGPIKLPV